MEKLMLLTAFAQVLLTSAVMIVMGRRRINAARNKEINASAFRTMNLTGANEQVIATSRNFDNQFQMPMLFIFSVLFILQFALADIGFVALAAAFVVLRVMHTVVHIGSNSVRLRFRVFLLGCLVLWIIWIRLVLLALL
ncbi:hypothetical protein WG68_03160 [Arsukibacterium ikkense]|uniref:MAPEG family protein n=1 Tax=Arsukibacterium ikkense TaxID=336831 RepID=A0A0M2V933_9GAMM|nr:MAPEG family protein [Arsukibacterium ikkense]KKO46949.1 hypothetical protein WG68_03160 [Arsukibacterium ikkense]